MVRVRATRKEEAPAWLRMRDALWPDYASTWHTCRFAITPKTASPIRSHTSRGGMS